jgi:large subunit ribosomal protein L4
MNIPVYNKEGEKVGTTSLSSELFDVRFNPDVVHQVITSMDANARATLAHTKDRSEVRGGGKKPWKQKGTGRARHGSIRSPIWKGGGVTFGPRKEKNYSVKINKKMRRTALAMTLSAKVKDNELFVIDTFAIPSAKTKEMAAAIKMFFSKAMPDGADRIPSTLIVTPKNDLNIRRSAGNLSRIFVSRASDLNPKLVLEKKCIIMLQESLPVLQTTFIKSKA